MSLSFMKTVEGCVCVGGGGGGGGGVIGGRGEGGGHVKQYICSVRSDRISC